MEIRTAAPADIAGILALLRQILAFHHTGRPDLFLSAGEKYNETELEAILADPDKTILVAAEKETILGYVFCVLRESHPPLVPRKTLFLDDVCVAEAYRKTGLGSRLMEAAADLARKKGCYNVTLNVWEFPGSAKAFYEKCGFGVQKTTMEKVL